MLHKFDTDNTCLVWNITKGPLPDTLLVTETRQLAFLDTLGVDHTHAITARVDIPNPEVPGKMRIRWPTCEYGDRKMGKGGMGGEGGIKGWGLEEMV